MKELVCKITLTKDKKEITFNPSLEEWGKKLKSVHSYAIYSFKKILCMKTSEIGAARNDGFLKIFTGEDDPLEI